VGVRGSQVAHKLTTRNATIKHSHSDRTVLVGTIHAYTPTPRRTSARPARAAAKRVRRLPVVLILALLGVGAGSGAALAQEPRDASPAGATLGAVLGGAGGFFGGLWLGASGDCYEICEELVLGAIAGEIVGVAVGAHGGNGFRGNVFADLGVSAGVGALGLLLTSRAESRGAVLLAATLFQVAGVVWTEVRTSPMIAITPGSDGARGRIGLVVGVRF